MRLLQDFLDRSKQLNQTSSLRRHPAYHAPNKKYKIIHQALILPNLPAPLHYLNFFSILGQPSIPILRNSDAIRTSALDTATTLCSSSLHQVGQLKSYSIQQDCQFLEGSFQFGQYEKLIGDFPAFVLRRQDSELSLDLKIKTLPLISHFAQLRFSMAEHWSMMCHCEGIIQHQDIQYEITGLGSFEYARSYNFPYLPIVFFTYQMINLQHDRQIILAHIRDQTNRVIQSRIYLRDLRAQRNRLFDRQVFFKVHRLYPAIVTPNGQKMYLPREFEWCCADQDGTKIWIGGQSRGDFKFGLGAGYVGSFSYEIRIDGENETGEGGYMEYVDCRRLCYQEQDKDHKLQHKLANPVPFMLKK